MPKEKPRRNKTRAPGKKKGTARGIKNGKPRKKKPRNMKPRDGKALIMGAGGAVKAIVNSVRVKGPSPDLTTFKREIKNVVETERHRRAGLIGKHLLPGHAKKLRRLDKNSLERRGMGGEMVNWEIGESKAGHPRFSIGVEGYPYLGIRPERLAPHIVVKHLGKKIGIDINAKMTNLEERRILERYLGLRTRKRGRFKREIVLANPKDATRIFHQKVNGALDAMHEISQIPRKMKRA